MEGNKSYGGSIEITGDVSPTDVIVSINGVACIEPILIGSEYYYNLPNNSCAAYLPSSGGKLISGDVALNGAPTLVVSSFEVVLS